MNNEISSIENEILCYDRIKNKGVKNSNINYVLLLYNNVMINELENSLKTVYIYIYYNLICI